MFLGHCYKTQQGSGVRAGTGALAPVPIPWAPEGGTAVLADVCPHRGELPAG